MITVVKLKRQKPNLIQRNCKFLSSYFEAIRISLSHKKMIKTNLIFNIRTGKVPTTIDRNSVCKLSMIIFGASFYFNCQCRFIGFFLCERAHFFSEIMLNVIIFSCLFNMIE